MKSLTYAIRLSRLRAKIFGEVVRESNLSQYKVVQYFSQRPWHKDLPQWYPPTDKFNSLLHHVRHLGLFYDEHLHFSEAMQNQRKERGKGVPKKGHGKRAKKGKGKKK